MYWIVISILGLMVLIVSWLYWEGVKERNCMRSFLIQVLLDEKTYEFQKEGLKKLVLSLEATNAMVLANRVNFSIDRLVNESCSNTMLASHSLLWEAREVIAGKDGLSE